MHNLLKLLTLTTCLIASTTVLATNTLTTCPTPAEIKKIFSYDGVNFDDDLTYTIPAGIDIRNHTMKSTVATTHCSKKNKLALMIFDIVVHPDESAEKLAFTTIDALQSESATPINDDGVLACLYSLPNNNGEMKAFIMQNAQCTSKDIFRR